MVEPGSAQRHLKKRTHTFVDNGHFSMSQALLRLRGGSAVVIPASVEVLDKDKLAEYWPDRPTDVTVTFEPGSNCKRIAEFCFRSTVLKTITIPSSVETLGKACFWEATLDILVFEPNSRLREIEDFAFAFSTLKSICIPASVESIGKNCFTGSDHKPKSFDAFTFEPKSKLTMIDECCFGCCTISKLVIPASVEIVSQLSFYKAAIDFVSFEPEAKVREIGDRAFQYGKFLLIVIPKSVEVIGLSCFAGDCRRGSRLDSFVIEPESVLSQVGADSFAHCAIRASTVPPDVRKKFPNSFPAELGPAAASSKCCLIL
jgi:hypothetical protein